MGRIVNPIGCTSCPQALADGATQCLRWNQTAMIRILLAEDEEAMRAYLARAGKRRL